MSSTSVTDYNVNDVNDNVECVAVAIHFYFVHRAISSAKCGKKTCHIQFIYESVTIGDLVIY